LANTTVGFDGVNRAQLAPAIGSYVPIIPFKCTPSGTTTSEAITFSQLTTIVGVVIFPLGAAGVSGISDGGIGPTVTFTGNVLTIADGTDFDLDQSSSIIYGIVWGTPRA
jgi:hypothetical protein